MGLYMRSMICWPNYYFGRWFYEARRLDGGEFRASNA